MNVKKPCVHVRSYPTHPTRLVITVYKMGSDYPPIRGVLLLVARYHCRKIPIALTEPEFWRTKGAKLRERLVETATQRPLVWAFAPGSGHARVRVIALASREFRKNLRDSRSTRPADAPALACPVLTIRGE
jgi:hypothetical protein